MLRPTLLHPPEDQAALEKSVRSVVEDVWASAKRLLGDTHARALFHATATGKAGRPKGSRENPRRDAEWLDLYDKYMAEKLRRGERKSLTEFAKTLVGSKKGLSAIEMHMGRLLAKREAEKLRMERYTTEMERLGLGPTLLETLKYK